MFKKPNQKSITNAAIQGGSMVVGAKIGDALVVLAPESMSSYKRIIVGIAGIAIAASIPATSTGSTIAQSAALGMGVKALYDEVTDALTDAVPVKIAVQGAALGSTDKFVNALVGHKEPTLTMTAGLSAAWGGEAFDDNLWERPTALLENQIEASNFGG